MSSTTSSLKAAKVPVYQGVLAYFPRALLEISKVSDYGAVKHDTSLAEKGFLRPEYTDEMFLDAEVRHILKRVIEGEINPEDGDLMHLAQKAWNSLASLEKKLIAMEENGEWKI